MRVELPIKTGSGLNDREHWRVRAKRVYAEKRMVGFALGGKPKPELPCVVTLTRKSAGTLDDDNVRGAMKAIRDAVADWLGVDDKHSHIVRYEYAQEKAKRGMWGVRIEIEAVQQRAASGQMPERGSAAAGRQEHEMTG